MNLFNDLNKALKINGKKMDDVRWVGCEDFKISVENFVRCADIEVGKASVAEDLVLVGDNWYIRYVSSGSDLPGFWAFEYMPNEPTVTLEVDSIIKTDESEARRWSDESGNYINSLKYMVTDYNSENT